MTHICQCPEQYHPWKMSPSSTQGGIILQCKLKKEKNMWVCVSEGLVFTSCDPVKRRGPLDCRVHQPASYNPQKARATALLNSSSLHFSSAVDDSCMEAPGRLLPTWGHFPHSLHSFAQWPDLQGLKVANCTAVLGILGFVGYLWVY